MNPFLVHLANKVKEVYLYTVFLHPEALVISERLLDESKEHTVYAYIMHIPVCSYITLNSGCNIAFFNLDFWDDFSGKLSWISRSICCL